MLILAGAFKRFINKIHKMASRTFTKRAYNPHDLINKEQTRELLKIK